MREALADDIAVLLVFFSFVMRKVIVEWAYLVPEM